VLGTGEVGRRLAAGFASRGHDVMIGSRDPAKPDLREWLSGDGAGIRGGTFAEAAAHGELIVLASWAMPRRRRSPMPGPRTSAARW
jgi:predicted dinucleotide-binding enzyme